MQTILRFVVDNKFSARSPLLLNLDFFRGIAALAVLVWHYQHFYYPKAGVLPDGDFRSGQPFYESLQILYSHGWMAVQFFWVISGFVIFLVYGRGDGFDWKKYLAARFSRLYPLHFLTLSLVALLQFICARALGYFQIYPYNDLYHFLLNVFFASSWGLELGFSFNAPVWSVSVEVIVYFIFALFMLFAGRLGRWLHVFLMLILLWFAYFFDGGTIVSCALCFYMGCAACLVFERAGNMQKWHATLIAGLLFFLALASVPYVGESRELKAIQFFVFPVFVLFAALLDVSGLSVGSVGHFFGKLTYSSYLIHVPVQIFVLLLLDGFGISRSVANDELFFLGYIAIVFILSVATYNHIEMPLKNWALSRIGGQRQPTT